MSFDLFETQKQLLPVSCKPYKDEAFTSWITRMSFDSGLKINQFVNLLSLGTSTWLEINMERFYTDQQLVPWAKKTKCTIEELRNTCHLHYAGKLFNLKSGSAIYRGWLLNTFVKNAGIAVNHEKPGLAYCPRCMAGTGQVYYKRQWRLTVSFVCTECGCYLRETCPHCGEGSSYLRGTVDVGKYETIEEYLKTCDSCGKDVSDCEAETAPYRLIELQRKIDELLEEGCGANIPDSVSYFEVLFGMARLMIGKCVKKKKVTYYTEKKFKVMINKVHELHGLPQLEWTNDLYVKDVRFLTLKDRANAFLMADWLLQDWPKHYIELSDHHNWPWRGILRYFTNPPVWFSERVTQAAMYRYRRCQERAKFHEQQTSSILP